MRPLVVLAMVAASAFAPAAGLRSQPAAAQAGRDAAVPFKVGERLTYDVTWSTFLVAGAAYATVAARLDDQGGPAYHLIADGRPIPLLQRLYNVYYKMESMLDTVTLLPHRMSMLSEEKAGRRLAATRFDRPARKAFFELDDAGTPLKSEFDVPPQVQDGLSAVYVLRAMNFKAGDKISLPITDDGTMYTVQADPVALEQVRVPLGTMEAWRVNVTVLDAAGQPAIGDAAVWYSTDARRLPIKLQGRLPVGHFVLLSCEEARSARPLKIMLNGDPYDVPGPLTIADLLARLDIDSRRVAVERNLVVLKRALFDTTEVSDGDQIEIVNFVGGG